MFYSSKTDEGTAFYRILLKGKHCRFYNLKPVHLQIYNYGYLVTIQNCRVYNLKPVHLHFVKYLWMFEAFSLCYCHQNLKYINTFKRNNPSRTRTSHGPSSWLKHQPNYFLKCTSENGHISAKWLSRTLKVGEKRVPWEFRFLAYWLRYGRF